MVTVDGHFPEVCPPHSARVFAEIIFGLAVEPVPGALNVLRGKRLAIVPFDTLPKLECEAGAVLVPRPALGKLGNNRIDATDRLHRVKHDEPIEDGASSHHGRETDLLQARQARGVRADVHAMRSPVLLREGWISTKTDGDDRSRFCQVVNSILELIVGALHREAVAASHTDRRLRSMWGNLSRRRCGGLGCEPDVDQGCTGPLPDGRCIGAGYAINDVMGSW